MAETETIDIAEVIERQKLTGFILKLVAVSVLVTFFDGYDMQGIAYVAPYLQPAFHLDRLMLGNIFSAGIAGNFIGAMAIGWLGDYFGRRPAIVWSTVAFGVVGRYVPYAEPWIPSDVNQASGLPSYVDWTSPPWRWGTRGTGAWAPG